MGAEGNCWKTLRNVKYPECAGWRPSLLGGRPSLVGWRPMQEMSHDLGLGSDSLANRRPGRKGQRSLSKRASPGLPCGEQMVRRQQCYTRLEWKDSINPCSCFIVQMMHFYASLCKGGVHEKPVRRPKV